MVTPISLGDWKPYIDVIVQTKQIISIIDHSYTKVQALQRRSRKNKWAEGRNFFERFCSDERVTLHYGRQITLLRCNFFFFLASKIEIISKLNVRMTEGAHEIKLLLHSINSFSHFNVLYPEQICENLFQVDIFHATPTDSNDIYIIRA